MTTTVKGLLRARGEALGVLGALGLPDGSRLFAQGTPYWIPGLPVAQSRPRVRVRGGRPHAYEAKKAAAWKQAARVCLRAQAAEQSGPLARPGPLGVWLVAVWPLATRNGPAALWRAKRPDLDNLVKIALDAANGLLWQDDAQVAMLVAYKIAARGCGPGVLLRVRGVGEIPDRSGLLAAQ